MALMKFITENALNSSYVEKYKDDNAIGNVVNYVCNPEKTDGCIGGWAVDPCHAAYEMELLAKLFHNDRGVRLRHWVITFRIVSCVNWKADFAAMLWLLYIAWARIFPHFIKKDTKSYMLFMVVTGHISIL